MTEKRYLIEELGNMFRVLKDNEPLTTKFENTDKIDVINLVEELNELAEENTRLKERNNRQCKQLDNLYKLIEKQDWETLTGIIQELKEADERLQKEWGTYGDFE